MFTVEQLVFGIIGLVILGLAWYLIDRYVPMEEPIKLVIRVILIIALVLWLLSTFGIIGPVLVR